MGTFRYEARFIAAQSQTHRHEILGGLAVHAAAVLLQWHVVCSPEYHYDYAAAGDPDLSVDLSRAQLILGLHLLVTVSTCASLARDIFYNPRFAASSTGRRRILLLKVEFLICIYTTRPGPWPSKFFCHSMSFATLNVHVLRKKSDSLKDSCP